MSAEQTMTAGELLTRYEANPPTDDQPYEAEVYIGSTWRVLVQVCTDLNDESEPVFLDVVGAPRSALTKGDEVRVRGLPD